MNMESPTHTSLLVPLFTYSFAPQLVSCLWQTGGIIQSESEGLRIRGLYSPSLSLKVQGPEGLICEGSRRWCLSSSRNIRALTNVGDWCSDPHPSHSSSHGSGTNNSTHFKQDTSPLLPLRPVTPTSPCPGAFVSFLFHLELLELLPLLTCDLANGHSWRGPDHQFCLLFLLSRLHKSLVLSSLLALAMSGYVNAFTVQG